MDLTSYRRIRYMFPNSDGAIADDAKNARRYIPFITAISKSIENHLLRELETKARTEYFDTIPGQVEFFTKAYPITTLTSMKTDSTGLYTGSQTTESDTYIGKNTNSAVLDTSATPAIKGLQIVYTGGMAAHGTQSQFTLSTEGATALVAGNFVQGASSGAVGYVVTKLLTAITIEVLYGVFIVGETVNGKTTEDNDNISGATAVLSARTVESLAESYPDIVAACEMELMYRERHKTDMENGSTIKGQTSRRNFTQTYTLQPEVREMLEGYLNFPL